MAPRKLRDHWWVDFRYRGRRYRFRSVADSRDGASDYEDTLRGALARGEDPLAKHREETMPTFAEFSEHWFRTYVQNNNKPSERAQKRSTLNVHLLPAFGRMRLADIGAEQVESFKSAMLRAKRSAKTINNALGVLRKCLNTAYEWDLLERPPRIRALKSLLPTVRYLSAAEADALLAATPDGLWRSMVFLALRTGLRFSELVGLRWEDVDLEARRLTVERANVCGWVGTPKSGKSRHVPLTLDAVETLARLQRHGPLVFSREGQWIRHEAARRMLHRACEAAGIERLGWHALRHTFASQLVARRAPLKAVQDLLGHATLAMTMRYSHLDDEHLRAAVSLLEAPQAPPLEREEATGGRSVVNAPWRGELKRHSTNEQTIRYLVGIGG